mmetsp:Transcript_20821/g.83015  ORF Transcript_20821/g.83015 Transcript_20821/m.83015 type:complete len:255 (-) Transcript_20821:434-1198(-)
MAHAATPTARKAMTKAAMLDARRAAAAFFFWSRSPYAVGAWVSVGAGVVGRGVGAGVLGGPLFPPSSSSSSSNKLNAGGAVRSIQSFGTHAVRDERDAKVVEKPSTPSIAAKHVPSTVASTSVLHACAAASACEAHSAPARHAHTGHSVCASRTAPPAGSTTRARPPAMAVAHAPFSFGGASPNAAATAALCCSVVAFVIASTGADRAGHKAATSGEKLAHCSWISFAAHRRGPSAASRSHSTRITGTSGAERQ